jgi:hypothetical protein
MFLAALVTKAFSGIESDWGECIATVGNAHMKHPANAFPMS